MLQEAWKLTCDDVFAERIEEIGLEVLETLGHSPQIRAFEQLFSLFDRDNSNEKMGQLLERLNEAREEVIVDLYNDELVGFGQTGLHSSSRRYDLIQSEFWRGRPGVRDKLYEALGYINEHKVLDIQTCFHKEVIMEILNYFKSIKPNEYKEIESLEFSTFRKNITLYRNR